jgi:tetratricopeptide (TPR) repeat protein
VAGRFGTLIVAAALIGCTTAPSETPDARACYERACAKLRAEPPEATSALEDLDRSIELWPGDFAAYYARAMTYAVLGRYREASQDLLICIRSGDKALARKAHFKLARIFDEKFDDLQGPALAHYEKYLQLGGTDPLALRRKEALQKEDPLVREDDRERKAAAMFDVAEELLREGKIDTGAAMIEEMMRRFPDTEASRTRAPAVLVDLIKRGKAQ